MRLNARAGQDRLPSAKSKALLAADGWEPLDEDVLKRSKKHSFEKPSAETSITDGPQPGEKAFRVDVTAGIPVYAHKRTIPVRPGEFYRIRFSTKKENGYCYWGPGGWFLLLDFLDADGKRVGPPANAFAPHDNIILDRTYDKADTDWTTLTRDLKVPEGAVRMRAVIVAKSYTTEKKLKLWTGPVNVEPAPVPIRARRQRFLALLSPLDRNAPQPAFVGTQFGPDGRDGSIARAAVPGGQAVILSTDGPSVASAAAPISGQAELAVARFADVDSELVRSTCLPGRPDRFELGKLSR